MLIDKDSFAHGPIESKIWLCHELARLGLGATRNIYILGAWSGTMPFLFYVLRPMGYERMVLVDVNTDYLQQAQTICNAIDTNGQLVLLNQDANTINYDLAAKNLVINTSVDNILGRGWWQNIPHGAVVALQARTGDHRDRVVVYETLESFDKDYPMSQSLGLWSKSFTYPDNSYTRFMKIGIK